MSVALNPELPSNLLKHLIVADIAPSRGAMSSEFQGYVEAMKKIEQSQVTSRQEAQKILAPYESVCSAFLHPGSPSTYSFLTLGSNDKSFPTN